MEIEWTNAQVIRLIEEYKKRPELWDTTHYLYRVVTSKYESWSRLAEEFDCDIVDLRRKLNSLFASYRREKGKIRIGGRSSWFLYPYMNFMPNHLPDDSKGQEEDMKSMINARLQPETEVYFTEDNEAEVEEMEDTTYDNVIQEEIIIKEEPRIDVKVTSKRIKPCTSTHKPRIKRVTKRRVVGCQSNQQSSKLDSNLLEMLKLLRRSELSKKKDECDSFGEYIADSLKKHDDKTQCMIKQAINNILFEQEMKKYNSSATLTLVLNGLDENPLKLMGEGDQQK